MKEWKERGYWAYRNHESKPFDISVMGHGISYMIEAKNWRKYPKDLRRIANEYQELEVRATDHGCEAFLYCKLGRGKYNYVVLRLNQCKRKSMHRIQRP